MSASTVPYNVRVHLCVLHVHAACRMSVRTRTRTRADARAHACVAQPRRRTFRTTREASQHLSLFLRKSRQKSHTVSTAVVGGSDEDEDDGDGEFSLRSARSNDVCDQSQSKDD